VILGLGCGVVLVVLLARRHSRKSRRAVSSDALSEALGTVKPYKGKAWEVGERWL